MLVQSDGCGTMRLMIDRNTYVTVSGLIFAAIAVLHAGRIAYGWNAEIGGWMMPMWFSWVGVAIAGYLAYSAFTYQSRR